MASVTVYLDTRTPRKSNLYPILLLVRNGTDQRSINTGFKIEKHQWAKNKVVRHQNAFVINARIADITNEANRHFADCLLNNRPIKIDLIGTGRTSYSFTEYIEYRSKALKEKEMIIMYKKYLRVAKEIRAALGEVLFSELNQSALAKLEKHMSGNGNSANTRHKKFKLIGEIYGHGINEGKAEGKNPFKEYKIKTTPVKKEKLSVEEIECIASAEVSGETDIIRDMFMFSYYSKGVRFENVLLFKASNIQKGRLIFIANKSGKHISVKIHAKLQSIIDKYSKKGYLFPLVKKEPETKTEKLSVVGSWNTIANRNLKIIAAHCGIKTALTFHLARHSFAYHMKSVTDSIHVISDSLGHSSSSTTEIYLKSLDDERLDKEVGKLYGD